MTVLAETKPFFFAPFVSSTMAIEPGWIDYNGHLNMAYYSVLLDRATDEAFDILGIGQDYVRERNASVFTAEWHVQYKRELRLDDPVRATIQLIEFDDKRIHTYLELRHARELWLAAAAESLNLHVDMTTRRVAALPARRHREPRDHEGRASRASHARRARTKSSAFPSAQRPAGPGCTDAGQARLAMLRPASAIDFMPNRTKVTPTTRLTMPPCFRKKRRTCGSPAQNRITT